MCEEKRTARSFSAVQENFCMVLVAVRRAWRGTESTVSLASLLVAAVASVLAAVFFLGGMVAVGESVDVGGW